MEFTDVVVFFLVFVRMISFLGTSPLFTIRGIPNLVKVAFGLLLTYLVFNFIGFKPELIPQTTAGLVSAALGECIFGLTMGFITTLVFEAVKMAGQLMDIQIGFSMSSEFDITGGSSVTLVGNLSYMVAILVFFLVNGHHMLIQTLLQSFDIVPVLGVSLPADIGPYILSLFIKTFILALKLAAPVVIVLFLTDFTMGLISRTVPQLNVLMMAMPVKAYIGLIALAVVLPGLIQVIIKSFDGIQFDLRDFFKLFPLAIAFASSDKTEEPTQKKKDDAKKKGQVAKSREFISAVTLVGITLTAVAAGDMGLKTIQNFLTNSLNNIGQLTMGEGQLTNVFTYSVLEFVKITIPVFVVVIVLGVMGNLVQTGFIHSSEPLKPKFSRMNPIEGFKRMFSGKAVMELLKSIANITIVGYIAYSFVSGQIFRILNISDMGVTSLLAIPRDIIQSELMQVAIVICVIGIIDLIYQKRAYKKELRMTKQEVKEEFKQMEGDPKIKSAIRQRQRQMAQRRMMHEVPKATVVITNPTHLAIALKYQQGKDSSPIVVAKGADLLAKRIKQVAGENNVPVIENKPVARMLYEKVEIDQTIPVELYQAVAEILAVVYSLKKKA